MSRIGRQPIIIPDNVTVTINKDKVTAKGPKGELTQQLTKVIEVAQKENEIIVSVKNPEDKKQKALWGLSQRLISNIIIGVTDGFSKQLEVNGVGYKAIIQGNTLTLHVGYSHQVDYPIPEDIKIEVEKNLITVSGINKQQVGQVAAEIRKVRKPEPYKGKGIKYVDEVIRRKVGKTAAKTE